MGGGSIQSFLDWANSGLARVGSGLMTGIEQIAGGALGIVVEIFKAIAYLGEALSYWGGLILEAIVEIIWFIAFLVVVIFWAKFLEIMKWVTLGQPERALATGTQGARSIIRVGSKATKTATKAAGTATKAAKAGKSAAGKTKRWYDNRKGGNN